MVGRVTNPLSSLFRIGSFICSNLTCTEHEMLAQILHDLYIPEEILDQLPDDQKQLLFFKMREEQVRRYHEREALDVMKTHMHARRKKKQVTFRLDANGNEYCWVMGECLGDVSQSLHPRINNENMDIEYPTPDNTCRSTMNHVPKFPINDGAFYTVHRDERKQIEEISNNIQEARRVFERLETETRKLALTRENEISQPSKRSYNSSMPIYQSDFVDEKCCPESEKSVKKIDHERHEATLRIQDLVDDQISEPNVGFKIDNSMNFTLQPMLLNSSNRTKSTEKKLRLEPEEKHLRAFPVFSSNSLKKLETSPERQTTVNNAVHQQSGSASVITRADICRWFRTTELLYGAFRSTNGQIYPWFHGIISRAHAEQLLSAKPIGTYLIRVSEKIFGYVLSYLASDHCRHLLIEITEQGHAYRFLGGAKYELFDSLCQLIDKYTNIPIRSNSTDVLRYPCGQIDSQQADYADLFSEKTQNDSSCESLYIPLDTTTSSQQSTTHL